MGNLDRVVGVSCLILCTWKTLFYKEEEAVITYDPVADTNLKRMSVRHQEKPGKGVKM